MLKMVCVCGVLLLSAEFLNGVGARHIGKVIARLIYQYSGKLDSPKSKCCDFYSNPYSIWIVP